MFSPINIKFLFTSEHDKHRQAIIIVICRPVIRVKSPPISGVLTIASSVVYQLLHQSTTLSNVSNVFAIRIIRQSIEQGKPVRSFDIN